MLNKSYSSPKWKASSLPTPSNGANKLSIPKTFGMRLSSVDLLSHSYMETPYILFLTSEISKMNARDGLLARGEVSNKVLGNSQCDNQKSLNYSELIPTNQALHGVTGAGLDAISLMDGDLRVLIKKLKVIQIQSNNLLKCLMTIKVLRYLFTTVSMTSKLTMSDLKKLSKISTGRVVHRCLRETMAHTTNGNIITSPVVKLKEVVRCFTKINLPS